LICDEVLLNSRNVDDGLNTSFTILCALTHSKVFESVEYGFQVLSVQLGVDIPRSASQENTLKLIIQTQAMLDEISDDTLLNYPVSTDNKKNIAMKFLVKLGSSIVQVNPSIAPLAIIKMLELTIEHGVSSMSAYAFSCFGGIIAELSDIRSGYRYIRLAKALFEKHPSNEIAGEVIMQSTEILAYFEPLQAVNEHRIQGQTTAMAAGDVHSACMNKTSFATHLIWTGLNLFGVKEELIRASHVSNYQGLSGIAYLYNWTSSILLLTVDSSRMSTVTRHLTS